MSPDGSTSLPELLAAATCARWSRPCVSAHAAERGIVWGLGAHVIKTGLGPVLIDLMERGFVSAIALNGAGLIHDFEVALSGATSEDVDAALGPGQFGMAEETGRELNEAITAGARESLGLGQAVCAHLAQRVAADSPALSLLCAAARLAIPVTVHVGIGTDIIHMHPAASGEAIGAASLRDFRYFTSFVARPRRRRVSQLRVGRDAARSLSEGRFARAQPRHLARRADDGEPRLRPACTGPKQTSSVVPSPASARATRSRVTTKS